jgi:hypothetical protein
MMAHIINTDIVCGQHHAVVDSSADWEVRPEGLHLVGCHRTPSQQHVDGMQYTHTAVLRLMVADLALSLLLSQRWDGLVR